MDQALKNIFYPNSICIAGASIKEKSIGYELLKTISSYGFRGVLYPVNPKAESVLGYKCYKSIEEITDTIDLAIVVVPKPFTETTIDSLLAKGVKSIVLITAGFKETGAEGEALEKRILQKIKDAGARMVGPNCMGVISTLPEIKLNATFVAEKPETGSTGFLSQSGALGAAVLNSLRETDIRFAHFISVGNKADISENTLLDFWEEDDNIKTFTFYLESFVNGEEFIKKYMSGEITKPSIVLKAGKTAGGMKAASSHTGALSSRDNVVSALLNQFGILRVNDLNELFNTAKGFENFPAANGNKVAVITNAGGPAILAVDSLEKEGLTLAEFSEITREKLREVVHPEGSVLNPVDLLPGGDATAYRRVNEIVAEDENVDAIISIFVEPVMVQPFDVVESVYDIKTEKPVLQVDMPLPEFWENYRKNSKKNLPVFRNPEDPAPVIANMLFHKYGQAKIKRNLDEYKELLALKPSGLNLSEGFLPQKEINSLAEKYNLPVIKNKILKPDELDSWDEEFYPLVVKGLNSKVIHKSELNAVKLNIINKEQLLNAAAEIKKSFNRFNFEIEEYLIQPFINSRHEVLIGGFRDPSFGPVIMFGTGGKYVEVICDTAIRSAYLSSEDIDEMIQSTVIGKILAGVRGEAPVNVKRIKEIINSSARMLIENPSILEFDFNPLLIDDKNVVHAVDIRIKIG